jgi:hypothetical protein
MHPEVHRYLDGELPRSALSAEAQAELKEWESLEQAVAQRRSERAPPWLANGVMRALPEPQAASWRRALDWLVTPRPINVPPFAPLAAAALVVFIMMLPQSPVAVQPGSMDAALRVDATTGPIVYVQFELRAEGAHSVAVAGDFNDWSPDVGLLRDPNDDGVWRGLVPVRPGVHKYMFVVNGEEWVTDPVAESYVDDGFGMRNALLAVAPPGETL